jgi:DNA (cytosine-5)-methyltransferase 1
MPLVRAIYLFCGACGLTRGLEKLGIDDSACKFPFTTNNNAEFLLKSVGDLSVAELIGHAVPAKLAEAIVKTPLSHSQAYQASNKRVA